MYFINVIAVRPHLIIVFLFKKARLTPVGSNMFLDVVSVRRTMPAGINFENNIDYSFVNERRVIPGLQIAPNTLTVAKSDQTVTISIRPGNCSFDLNPFSLVNSFDQVIFLF